ncbi:MAG: transporter substrate-binding domain-containing protein [Pseudomonadota bacterium]
MTGLLRRMGSASFLALMLALPAGEAEAQRISCGEFYEVQAGDTLRDIAIAAYQSGVFEPIFEANRNTLATPSLLLVGQRLFIPCLDGTGPSTRESFDAQAVQDPLQAPELSASTLALPAPVPQPTEEELFGDLEQAANTTAQPEARIAALSQGVVPRARQPRSAPSSREFVPQTDSQRLAVTGRTTQLLQPAVARTGRAARGDAGAIAGIQPGLVTASGTQRAAAGQHSAGAIAGIQPARRSGGVGQIAGIQPAASGPASQTVATPVVGGIAGIQPGRPAPAAEAAQPTPSAAEAAQPTREPAVVLLGALPVSEAASDQPAAPNPEPAATRDQSATAAAAATEIISGLQTSTAEPSETPDPVSSRARVVAGPLGLQTSPQSAPRPRQQPAPDQPVPRLALSLDRELSSPNARILPDLPAQDTAQPSGTTQARAVAVITPGAEDSGQAPIRLLSGPYPPFAGQALPDNGMLSDVILRAIDRAAQGRSTRVSFINDWSAHLTILLPDGAFDVGYPWFRPDCENPGRLDAELRQRCADFVWSQPLHEMVIGYFVATDSQIEEAREYSALTGTRICRPEGEPLFDLAQNGLEPPRVSIVAAPSVEDCLTQLAEGEVDVVSLGVADAESAIAELGLAGRVTELPELADIVTLHALSPKTNPAGRAYITLVNRGLRQMRESGEWYEVVARHLAGIGN